MHFPLVLCYTFPTIIYTYSPTYALCCNTVTQVYLLNKCILQIFAIL